MLDLEWVAQHEGDYFDFITRHRKQARRMLEQGQKGIEKIAPALLRRISDERALRVAWDYLRQNGGQAPGPGGDGYDHPDYLIWQACRGIRDDVREGEYEPRSERVLWISKGPGR